MADDKIEIELIVDGKSVKTQINKIAKTIEKQGSEAGDSFGDGFRKGLQKPIGRTIAVAAAAGVAIAAVFTKRSIAAAQIQEDAVNRLNNSLRTTGSFSIEASESFQAFAAEIERTTRFGDELVLSQIGIAKAFGATNDQAKEIIKASLDLSAALNISLESAVRNVSKTLGGLSGELGESISALKDLGPEGLKAGKGIGLIAEKFKGAAQRDVQTYSGRIDQLANSFGTLQENFGAFLTSSVALRTILNQTKKNIDSLAISLKDVDAGFFDDFIEGSLRFATVVNDLIVFPLAKASQAFGQLQNFAALGIQFLANAAISIVKSFTGALSAIGLDTVLDKKLKAAVEVTDAAFREILQNIADRENELVNDSTIADSIGKIISDTQDAIKQARVDENGEPISLIGVSDNEKEKLQTDLSTMEGFYADFFTRLNANANNSKIQMSGAFRATAEESKKAGLSIRENFANIAKRSIDILARGIGSAFNKVGVALAEGGNAFKAFGQAIIGAVADIASSVGDTFIQLGIARILASYGSDATGYGLVAAGGALKVFGGFLSAKSGNGGGSTAPAAGGVASQPDPVATGGDDLFTEQEELTTVNRGTTLNVTVNGSIFDADDTPRRIADLLNAGFDTEDITLNQFAQA